MAVEELKYDVVAKYQGFELRQYAPYIVAETTVNGNFEWVGNVAFNRLAGYIFGRNRRKDSIAMTAPVTQTSERQTIAMTAPVFQEAQNAKIAMTAPVTQTGSENAWVISFVMPAEYTMENLPEPVDSRVRLVQRPGQLIAALQYPGTWFKVVYEEKRKQLESLIKQHGYVATGPAIFARFDPPLTLWFMRRNEVLIPVERVAQTEAA
jgi:hypothetical protein